MPKRTSRKRFLGMEREEVKNRTPAGNPEREFN
jgi:hypothetical protein